MSEHIPTEKEAAIIKKLLSEGVYQSRIAAQFGCNQGRISEINTGKRYSYVKPAR